MGATPGGGETGPGAGPGVTPAKPAVVEKPMAVKPATPESKPVDPKAITADGGQGENPQNSEKKDQNPADQPKSKDNPAQADEIGLEQINQLNSELTSQQNSVDADTATIILKIYASGRQMSQFCDRKAGELQAQAVKVEGGKAEVTDPQKLALALDLEIAGARFKLSKLAGDRKGKLSSDAEKQLSNRIKELEKQRAEGKIKITIDGKEVVANYAQLKHEPNQLVNFAKSLYLNLGLEQQQFDGLNKLAETNPFSAVEWIVEQAVANKEFQKGLISNLKESDLFKNNEAALKLLDESIIGSESKKRTVTEVKKKVAMGAGLMGLMMVLMMYVASKDKNQGAMGH